MMYAHCMVSRERNSWTFATFSMACCVADYKASGFLWSGGK